MLIRDERLRHSSKKRSVVVSIFPSDWPSLICALAYISVVERFTLRQLTKVDGRDDNTPTAKCRG